LIARVIDLSLPAHESGQINKSHRTSLIRFSNNKKPLIGLLAYELASISADKKSPFFGDAEDINSRVKFKYFQHKKKRT
jgi:hypothetical protein